MFQRGYRSLRCLYQWVRKSSMQVQWVLGLLFSVRHRYHIPRFMDRDMRTKFDDNLGDDFHN